jgi:hypothetical protein
MITLLQFNRIPGRQLVAVGLDILNVFGLGLPGVSAAWVG